ncbi:MAG: hypothetical protein DRH04_00715 [Deltaproteobacteria bacterium]|nr:MAG: hypothetical protein DRH04_00715 [Deltaproteobacteria bacterium]
MRPGLAKTDHRHLDPNSRQRNLFLGDDHEKAAAFREKVRTALLPANVLEVRTRQQDETRLEEDYLEEFVDRVTSFLQKQADEHRRREKEYSPLEIEQQNQSHFAGQKRQLFRGRGKPLREISAYLDSNHSQPLIIHGPSGRGKSALMAMAIARTAGPGSGGRPARTGSEHNFRVLPEKKRKIIDTTK